MFCIIKRSCLMMKWKIIKPTQSLPFQIYPIRLNFRGILEQPAFSFKVAPLEQISVVLPDALIKRHEGLLVPQTREGHGLLVEQRLQPEVASSTVIQHQDQVSCVRQHATRAESALGLRGVVGRRQGVAVLEEAQKGKERQEGLCVAHLDRHGFSHPLAWPGTRSSSVFLTQNQRCFKSQEVSISALIPILHRLFSVQGKIQQQTAIESISMYFNNQIAVQRD